MASDFPGLYKLADIRSLLIDKPIKELVGGRGFDGGPYFRFEGDEFGFAQRLSEVGTFGTLLREILDWRLAQYLARRPATDLVCRVSLDHIGSPVLTLPPNAGQLAQGPLDIEVDGRPMQAHVAKPIINAVCPAGCLNNELPTILRTWFGSNTGSPSRADRVRFRREGRKFAMEPVVASTNSGARLWERYLREEIPPIFGLEFSPAIWNVGFVVSEPNVFLLVTLAKDDMNADHRYSDHFQSDQMFNWQSQNRTAQESKHGRTIRDHRQKGTRVHLFVRPTKKTGSKSTPFIYCGEVEFVSWEGNRPITVRWRLGEKVPSSLHANLKVPAQKIVTR